MQQDLENPSKYNFGKALVELGYDKEFLFLGKHNAFHLQERSDLVKGILSKNLKLGNWKEVIDIVYGGIGGADQLYDGDRRNLDRDIIKSAKKNEACIRDLYDHQRRLLKEKNGECLLFSLAANLPSTDEDFMDVTGNIGDSPFFKDAVMSERRKRVYHRIVAKKAVDNGNFRRAFYHYSEVDKKDKINELFDKDLSEKDVNSNTLVEIALTDTENSKSKLKKLIVMDKVSPIQEFRLYK